jgi:hypothetical protein
MMMNQERLNRVKSGGLLDVIRERPVMYLGELSLSALWHFLNGYEMSLLAHDIQEKRPLPRDFHDWVAYRLHFSGSTSGYKNMILKRVPDEAAALEYFFKLLDEYRNRPSA